MKETLAAITATLFFLVSMGWLDPNMTVGELIGMYYHPQVAAEATMPEGSPVASDEKSVATVVEPSVELSTGEANEGSETKSELPVIVIEDPVEPTITLYTEADARAIASVMHAEANGLDDTQKKAVGWCVLNRVDDWERSIKSVVSEPNAFVSSSDYTEDELELAREVLYSWSVDGPRDLPEGYYYFAGDGEENFFRKELSGGERISLN